MNSRPRAAQAAATRPETGSSRYSRKHISGRPAARVTSPGYDAASAWSPSRSRVPTLVMWAGAFVSTIVARVARLAARETNSVARVEEIQVRDTASITSARPPTAASGKPLAIALP